MEEIRHWRSCVLMMVLAGEVGLSSVFAAQGGSGESAAYFVGPNGSDSWSGQVPTPNAEGTDGPFATLGAACGIRCSGTAVVVSDNHIHDIGLTYPSALALQGGGKDSQYSHNEIHDAPYTAINCGGENNRIEHNLIYQAMLELHDGGGIYCFAGKNLVLRGNFIRDIVDTGGYGASAYYLDERSENCLVEGNLSVGVVRPSHNHMAKNNTIRNNVFISDGDARLTFPRSSGYTFERNVLVAEGKIVFDNPDAITTWKNNVLFSRAGKLEGNKLERYGKKGTFELEPDGGNVYSDPQVVVFDRGVIRFAPGSPATKLGIKPIDVSGAGPRP